MKLRNGKITGAHKIVRKQNKACVLFSCHNPRKECEHVKECLNRYGDRPRAKRHVYCADHMIYYCISCATRIDEPPLRIF